MPAAFAIPAAVSAAASIYGAVKGGQSNSQSNAQNQLQYGANQSIANSNNQTGLGNQLMQTGAGNVQSGANYFNTLLNGNQANTSALLQPSINQIGANNANTVSALSTLMPRGGGRSGTLFGASYAPAGQIQNLFNSARTSAAQTLPQIGLQQQGLGANLFGLGNQALGTGGAMDQGLLNYGMQNREFMNQLYGTVGSSLQGLGSAFAKRFPQ